MGRGQLANELLPNSVTLMQTTLTRIAAVAATLSLLAVPIAPALAAVTPTWDVTGTYVSTFLLNGSPTTYPHDMFLVQDSSGNVTGNGGYPVGGPYQYSWHITSGTVAGDQINLTIAYDTGAVGTTMHMSGTIHADGTMSGIWDDNFGGTRNGTWSTTSGAAHVNVVVDWGQQLAASTCVGKTGAPVINVTEKIQNDADSGMAGNYWALDTINRHIQVWSVGSNTYCALVTYEGTFNAQQGQTGPGGTGQIGSGVTGTFKGGYHTTNFTGTLLAPTLWKTKGSVGTVDYQCNLSGTCLGAIDWTTKYFTGVSNFDLSWWGWLYDAGTHGTWVNSSEGSFGNIL